MQLKKHGRWRAIPNAIFAELKEKISKQHEGDEKQLEVIFSDNPRLIVEAPAGYGKTTTMISRIAYLFASGGIPNPKRILGLTFSVNAALKVKREVAEKLPVLLDEQNSPVAIGEKVSITNYHGFCKGVLKKYGFLTSDVFRKDVNLFKAISDSEISSRQGLNATLSARVLFNDGWGLVRASNTQPVLVARCEAKTPAGLARICGIIKAVLRQCPEAGDFEWED